MGIKYPNCRLLDNFDNTERKLCCKVSLYKNCQQQSCSAINCLSSGVNILAGGEPFPLKSWLQVTYPLLKAASFDTFCLEATQPQEIEKEVQLHLTRTRHVLSNEPSTKVSSRLWLPRNEDKVPKFVVFWTISTIKDKKSAAKLHYIKTVSGKVVEQSIAFQVVSIYWQGEGGKNPSPWNLGSKWPTSSWRQWVLTHFAL